MTCDDSCRLYMNTNPFDIADASTATHGDNLICSLSSHVAWRDYSRSSTEGQIQSAWIALTAGQKYYMEGQHREGTGSDFVTVSVEFETSTPPANHPNTRKAEQTFEIANTDQPELMTFTITNADGLNYKIAIKDDGTMENWIPEDSIATDASATTFKNHIKGFYSSGSRHGSSITVTKVTYDAADAITAVTADIAKTVYTV